MILLDPKRCLRGKIRSTQTFSIGASTKKISLSLINLQWANNLFKNAVNEFNLISIWCGHLLSTRFQLVLSPTLLQCLSDLMLESVLGKKISYVGNAESIHVRN